MSAETLPLAQQRIQHCKARGRDHLNLAGLALTDAELDGIAEFKQLTGLRYLDLTGNALTQLPPCVSTFTGLLWLGLNFNRLTSIEGVEKLAKLQRLYARGNVLADVPREFGNLSGLVELDLNGNRITSLPASFATLLAEERDLYFDLADNGSTISELVEAAEDLPAKRKALRNYLAELRVKSAVVRQGKLLLVGEGNVGKSTLLSVLRGEDYVKNNDSTHGLELRPLPLEASDGWEGTLHCWDFSGQPAMRQTHQLFFTSPALYLLVWNHRENREAETTAEIMEWLTMIDQRTEGAGRVLLVAKKGEGRDATPHDYAEILRRFGPKAKGGHGGILLPEPCLKVDSETPQAEAQIQALKRRIAGFAAAAENFNELRPASWIKAQEHFLGLRATQPYMAWSDFKEECEKTFGITDAEDYARTQDRLGALVWIDHRRLRAEGPLSREHREHLVVLNPDWLSKAVGFIIERDEQRQQRVGAEVPPSPAGVQAGLVSDAQMDAIWSDPPIAKGQPALVFERHLFDFFRDVMQAYGICREVRHSQGGAGRWFLIPNRLREGKPNAWQTAWRGDLPQVYWRVELRVKSEPRTEPEDPGTPLNQWLGRAIANRLMVTLHEHVLGRQDFAEAAHWRGGFILAPEGGGMARVEFNGSDRADAQTVTGFDLQVAAHQPREIWHVFDRTLTQLLHDLEKDYGYANISIARKLSCPVSMCDREAAQRYFIDDRVLLREAQTGAPGWENETTLCGVGVCGKRLPKGLLWEGRAVADPSQLDRIERKMEVQFELLGRVDRRTAAMERDLGSLLSEASGLHYRLERMDLLSEAGFQQVLNGQRQMEASLRRDLEKLSEGMHASMRESLVEIRKTLKALQASEDDLPRLYTLMPDDGLRLFTRRKWRLRLHCEKTGWPVCLVDPHRKGEFIIKESEPFLTAMAPYLRNISTVLIAMGPVTALLNSASLAGALIPTAVAAVAAWAKDYEKPVGALATMLKDRTSDKVKGLHETGTRPVFAAGPALQWLQDFIRSQANFEARLGLQAKCDGEGRRIWVLPQVEV